MRGQENLPVVFVTWNDAFAFCDWLTARWQEQDWLPEGWRVDLPSEPEWEKAARGGLKIPRSVQNKIRPPELMERLSANYELTENNLPQRIYPWGNVIDEEKLNYELNIEHVSSVGCYPLGSSPYGCEEMSGNVWEWTGSLYKEEYPLTEDLWQDRNIRSQAGSYVLRGGSFYFDRYNVRCAARDYYNPDFRSSYIGFRVVLSPLL